MYNSLVFLALFLVLLVFGYLSLLRLAAKQQFGTTSVSKMFNRENGLWLIDHSALNLTFILLPAISVLLFWGWSMAFLWLFIQHFLLESLFNLQGARSNFSFFENNQQIKNLPKLHRQCLDGLIQAYLILLSAACLYLLTYLVDRQSGLLLALIALYASFHAFNSQKQLGFRILLAIATLSFGVLLSHKIGLSFFGNWQPIPQLPWLDFNNKTIMASLLLVLTLTQLKNRQLHQQLTRVCGVLLLFLLLSLLVVLLANPQTIDAPIHNLSGESSPPSFVLFFLLLSIPAASFVMNAFVKKDTENEGNASKNTNHLALHRYFRQQSLSIFSLLLLVTIFVSLLTAAGIGAWQTHYQDWPESTPLLGHLQLTLNNLMATLSVSAPSPSNNGATIVASLFYFLVCALGLNTLMTTAKKINLHKPQKSNLSYALIVLITFYLLAEQVSFNHWLIFGALCWLLFVWLFLQHNIQNLKQNNNIQNKMIAAISLALTVIGCLQKLGFAYQLWQQTQLLMLIIIVTLLALTLVLLLRPCRQIISLIRIPSENDKLINSLSDKH